MNLLDLFIIVAMIFFVVRGIFRGFFKEIGSIAGVILGIWIGCLYQPQITAYLGAYFPSWKLLPILSFAAVFFVVFVLCNLGGWGLRIIFKKAFLGWADRILGAGLAILKGIIITYLVIVLLTFFVPSKTPFIAGSRLAPLIISSYQSIVSLISPDYYDNWKRKFSGRG
ncbi:MAG: CvpA family protein [Thermodesulfobacteriota bacterium]|nr:CvpA family protein [Thermodesulfobacteriota bacterium]